MRHLIASIVFATAVLTGQAASASAVYPTWLSDLMQGVSGTFLTSEVDCVLLDGTHYTYSAAHRTMADVPTLARVGTPLPLANKTFVGGKFAANSLTYLAVTGGAVVTGLACYTNLGSDAANRLVVFLNGINATAVGGSITINFDQTYGLFTL